MQLSSSVSADLPSYEVEALQKCQVVRFWSLQNSPYIKSSIRIAAQILSLNLFIAMEKGSQQQNATYPKAPCTPGTVIHHLGCFDQE